MAAGAVFLSSFIGHGPTGEQMVTTLHWIQTIEDAAVTPVTIVTVANQIDTLIVPTLLSCIGTDYVYDKTHVVGQFGDAVGVATDVLGNAGLPGTGSGLSGPFERSVIIQKITGVAGRGGRGRMFLPMPPVGNFTTDCQRILGGPDDGAFQTMATTILNPFTLVGIGDFSPCVFNRTTHTHAVLTNGSVGPLGGIQRRRRFGIGS